MKRTLLLLAIALLISAPTQAQTSSTPGSVLNPGDVLKIEVWRRPELSGEFTVAVDSSLNHPLYKEIKVVGISHVELDDRIRTFLARHEANPQYSLQPLLRVAVGGSVRQPNLYRLPPETTVAQAIVMAGGPVERTRMNKIRVLRRGQEIILDLTSAETLDLYTRVQSGDEIIVPRNRSLFRDYIVPVASIASGIVSLASFIIRITD